jgi:hypothetical protein
VAFNRRLEPPVLSVGCRVIRRGPKVSRAHELVGVFEGLRFKLSVLVRGDLQPPHPDHERDGGRLLVPAIG